MEKNVLWEKLLIHLKEQRIITNGITVPYLVGAYFLTYRSTPNKELLEEVISNLINSSSNSKPILQFCGDINEYVIGLKSSEFCATNYSNNTFFLNIQNDKTLFITSNASNFGKTEKELIENLWNRYQSQIESKCFSWRAMAQKWELFNDAEVNRIKQITDNQ